MTDTLIKDVSDTAFLVAFYRALEGDRSGALFHDPLSKKLAGEHGRRIVENANSAGPAAKRHADVMAWMMAMRTHIIDELIASSIAQGADAILNLGAGLDTRPYRMALPDSLHWIEVDYPRLIEIKETQLANEHPRCRLERLKLDLADRVARRELLAELDARFSNALVLTEGVVPYLSVEDVALLADDLKTLTSFRRWIVDYFSPQTLRYRKRAGSLWQMQNAPFRFEPGDYFGFFSTHGWRAKEIRYLWDEGQKLRRPMPFPLIAKAMYALGALLASPARRAAQRQFMAYVLFEPVFS